MFQNYLYIHADLVILMSSPMFGIDINSDQEWHMLSILVATFGTSAQLSIQTTPISCNGSTKSTIIQIITRGTGYILLGYYTCYIPTAFPKY